MRDFDGKVAVVTGAAAGMGLAYAQRCAAEGMAVVLADVQEDALSAAVLDLEQKEHRVIGVVADMSSREAVQKLADRAFDEFGGVNLLFNNAGVSSTTDAQFGSHTIWEVSDGDWEWIMGVNFWGVLYGVQAFVPRMIESGEEGHVVNTASVAAITSLGGAYGAAKHGVLSITEDLHRDLTGLGSRVSASVLFPGFVRTGITRAERNRPDSLGGASMDETVARQGAALLDRGKAPEEIAGHVFEAIREDRFYILPHPAWDMAVRDRAEAILARGSRYELDLMELIRNIPPGEKL